MINALGLLEVRGLAAAIEAADAMLKSASVRLLRQWQTDPGMISLIVEGDLAACRAALDAGARAAARLGEVISQREIGRPDADIEWLVQDLMAPAPVAPVAGEPPVPAPAAPDSGTMTPPAEIESSAVTESPAVTEPPTEIESPAVAESPAGIESSAAVPEAAVAAATEAVTEAVPEPVTTAVTEEAADPLPDEQAVLAFIAAAPDGLTLTQLQAAFPGISRRWLDERCRTKRLGRRHGRYILLA